MCSTCHVDMHMINSDISYRLYPISCWHFVMFHPNIRTFFNQAMEVYLSENDCNNYVTHIQILINIDLV